MALLKHMCILRQEQLLLVHTIEHSLDDEHKEWAKYRMLYNANRLTWFKQIITAQSAWSIFSSTEAESRGVN